MLGTVSASCQPHRILGLGNLVFEPLRKFLNISCLWITDCARRRRDVRDRVEPFNKDVSDPVGESVTQDWCVKCCDRALHGDADEKCLDESLREGFLEEVTPKQRLRGQITRQNRDGCSGQ